MCGIAGYTGPQIPGKLESLVSSMVHRGPDDDGYYHDKCVHLGMRRLAIVDLITGKQPKISSDGNVAVVFNGEIYNHRELRQELENKGRRFSSQSDTEVIVSLYQELGVNFVARLCGMFAVALYDRRIDALYLFRDRLGKKPIYYRRDRSTGVLEFASEFNTLKTEDGREWINREALAWYFSQKAIPGDASIDRRIRQVPAGCYLRHGLSDGSFDISRYYNGPVSSGRAKISDEKKAADRIERLLVDSVGLRMRADVEVGAFLSGGVDSSLIVALAAKATNRPLRTYCLVYDHEINEKGNDRKFARLVSEQFKTRHHEVLLTPQILMNELPAIVACYGQPNSAVISNWFIAKEMGKALKVALSGDGADEIFGSYYLHRAANAASDANFPEFIDRFGVFTDQELQLLLAPAAYRPGAIIEMIGARQKILKSRDPLNRMLEFDCRNLLCEQILNYSDTLSMAHSLEVRTPFLDHRLVEYAFRLDPRLKIRNGETKFVLKTVARRYLPESLVCRRKEGFVEPSVYWIADEMKDFRRSYLESASFNTLGLLNNDFVRDVVERYEREHEFAVAKKVWSLLMYAVWERGFCGGSRTCRT